MLEFGGLWKHEETQHALKKWHNSQLVDCGHYTEEEEEKLQKHPQPLCNLTINLSPSFRELGVIFDNTLCFKQHISNICMIAYLELRRMSSIRHCLSVDAITFSSAH